MDLFTIRNDVYAIANDADRRLAIADLLALAEDLEIEEQINDRTKDTEPLFSAEPVHVSIPTRAAVAAMFHGRVA